MESLQNLSLGLIQSLQSLSPGLYSPMKLFSFLGSGIFYMLVIPLIYWAINYTFGIRSLLLLITIDMAGSTLKLLFHQPRPYWIGPVKALSQEASYGIPSTHASGSLPFWGYLAYRLGRTRLWIIVTVLVVFIGLSRIYLGVHFLHDVVLGWMIGGAYLWVFAGSEDTVAAWMNRRGLLCRIGIGFALSVVMILVFQLISAAISGIPDPDAWRAYSVHARTPANVVALAGILFGAISGYALMKRYAHFDIAGHWAQRVGRCMLGITGIVVIYFGLNVVFGLMTAEGTALGYFLLYIQYCSMALWVTFIAPWIFIRVRLAEFAS
jgi:hypothetical protein